MRNNSVSFHNGRREKEGKNVASFLSDNESGSTITHILNNISLVDSRVNLPVFRKIVLLKLELLLFADAGRTDL